ncbi:methyltransferase domain-containing protein [Sphingobium phenoxybenzoativorans]|uniref:Methyltransferase domain-containing protein n=1 Tax=Sphingobium phenoxybenzoativorans TaxID=1592790 RepID=A0A975K878_9SPHN|nr:methyltransferase domain-containing protein [Sphingobium phenoxybenzoativorans]QUT06606.1 methyltransferase domain-containing protein [Sphingobium phenoxybenzoativorans]
MSPTRKDRIGAAFGAATAGYEDHAGVQKVVARTVADLAGLLKVPDSARILEIGCGTGLLTREIGLRWPGAELVATDLSAEMVGQAAKGAMIAGTFLPMDGEFPWFEGPHFDLILSSLAFQWFDDLASAVARLARLLRPGGSLIFSTMAERSFAAWRVAHAACGVVAGVPDYPSLADVQAMLAGQADAFAFDEDYALECGSAKGLIAHLKGIGAVVPVEGRSPLSPGDLRRVMAAFDAGGARDGYHVVFGRVTRVS